jgi:protein SCO1/2
LGGVAQVLDQLKNEVQKNFQVVTISFNPNDTAEIARNKKKNYLQSIDNSIPPESWRFLVGDENTIKKFTNAVGFKYKKQGEEYIHAAGSFMVSADGKIIRYLYGISFLPFDLKMAVTEALQSKVGSTARQVILYCFSYDPQSHKYVFNVTRVIGTVMLVFVIILFSFLMLLGKKMKKGKSFNV